MEKELSELSLEELWRLFPIILKEYNSEYKNWYEIEKKYLLNIIDKKYIVRINHIGSTSVEGLMSKPIVDILLEISNKSSMEEIKKAITSNGWTLMYHKDEPYMNIGFNKGYTKKGYSEKVFHLHVRYHGDWKELYFRDYLIDNKDVSEEYVNLKLSLIKTYKNNRDGYTEAKSDFILEYTNKAMKKYKNRYTPQF